LADKKIKVKEDLLSWRMLSFYHQMNISRRW